MMKKLISGLLSVLILASLFVGVIPLSAGAATSKYTFVEDALSVADKKKIAQNVKNYQYDTAEEALVAEDALGYLVSLEKGGYTIYVNIYTGAMYYKNNATGQILTSNPVNMHGMNDASTASYESGTIAKLMSQISVTLFDITSNVSYTYDTYTYAAMYGQISVQKIKDGLRVNYTVGDTTTRYLYPGQIRYDSFMEYILEPMLNTYRDMLLNYESKILAAYPDADFHFLDEDTCVGYPKGVKTSYDVVTDYSKFEGGDRYINPTELAKLIQNGTEYYRALMSSADKTSADALAKFISKLLTTGYSLENPYEYMEKASYKVILDEMYQNYPITQQGIPVFVAQKTAAKDMREYSNNIKKYATDFTYATMYEEEEICGYEYETVTTPVLRCSLEYKLDDDGTLLVNVPANSISFDTTVFTLKSFDLLPYFGAGNMTDEDGYVFYPDGCGTIVAFKDFFNDAQKPIINLSSAVFGQDYAYASVTGKHREQVTMPVYGVVNTVTAGETTNALYPGLDKVKNGYFAILEEGSSLANLRLISGGGEHRFMSVSTSYTPYPTDTVNLSESIGTGSSTATATTTSSSSNATVSLGNYTITGKSAYNGNYTIRYTMLCDSKIADLTPDVKGASFVSDYNGMAKCYREYLKADGTLTAIEKVSDNLPLYVEVIGAMEIDDTFLTFPIRKKIALTTFDDILKMYEDFDEAGLSSVNFKMTGFANGGIESTYPVRNKMEKVLGGLSAFKKLVKNAKSISEEDGKNLGLYPDYDFQYINFTSLFDGIGLKNNASRMLDNRYAAKRVYNSVSQSFEITGSTVIAGEALDRLYSRFLKKYRKTGAEGISVSTLGSDLSSNLDEKDTVDREEERQNVMAVLDRMAEDYSVMIDTGNIYAVKYATHILNAETDSSHFRYSSYAVPFVGMVLHGSVSYAGAPLNNSGSPEYEILRDIESGASLYYTLCYEHDNIAYMKQESSTNSYYSVDYDNWFDSIVKSYNELNGQIGDLQDYIISGHTVIKGERVVSETERQAFYTLLADAFLEQVKAQLEAAIDEENATLSEGQKLGVTVDTYDPDDTDEEIFDTFYEYMKFARYETENDNYELNKKFKDDLIEYVKAELAAIKTKTEAAYTGTDAEMTFDIDTFDTTKIPYSYLTDSEALAGHDYVETEYTCDNGNIVLVTYENETTHDVVKFILNYNIFSVVVKLDDEIYKLGKYSYVRIDD